MRIWQGPETYQNNDIQMWQELVVKHTGDIVFAGRSAILNNLYNLYNSIFDFKTCSLIQWLIQHGGKAENQINETCMSWFGLWYKYNPAARIFNLFAKGQGGEKDEMLISLIKYKLQRGYLRNLYRSIYYNNNSSLCKTSSNKRKRTEIGNLYFCKDVVFNKGSSSFNVNPDGSFTEPELNRSFNGNEWGILPVLVVDEAIGYNQELCVLIRYIDSTALTWESCYDEVNCL